MAQLGDPAQYALGGSYPDKQGVRWTDLATDPQLSGSEPRKAWLMTRNHVGSDVLASSAAALAAVAGVFQTVDYAYAELALFHAASLMAFAELGARQPHSYCDYVPCTVSRVVNRTVSAGSQGGGAGVKGAPPTRTPHPAPVNLSWYLPLNTLPLLLPLLPQALAKASVIETADSIPNCYYIDWTTSSCLIGDTLEICIQQRVKSVDVSACNGWRLMMMRYPCRYRHTHAHTRVHTCTSSQHVSCTLTHTCPPPLHTLTCMHTRAHTPRRFSRPSSRAATC